MEEGSRSSGLARRRFDPLPVGAIRPRGWLHAQLRIQAEGLSGHLDEFWPDIARSGWIGGDAEGWERGPYWLDGIVPLAFVLDDAGLKAKAARWVDYILAHQEADGWMGPRQSSGYESNDPWPLFVAFKALTQYQEATGDARILPAMLRCMRRVSAVMRETPLFQWGRFRWAELAMSAHWAYERTAEPWLLELAALGHAQGYDWAEHFRQFRYTGRIGMEQLAELSAESFDSGENTGYFATHVVNNAMGLKAAGVWYRQSRAEDDWAAATRGLEALDRYHGQAAGVFSGDEHLAGRNPSQGTELCAVVELMYSLEVLTALLGEAAPADRLERIAFNALPAPFKPDMWAHQYDQQANQVVCRIAEDRVYTNNGPDANLFGLEPHYGCCTANMHQGWPKFVTHLWMKTADPGLAAIAYAPCEVRTAIGDTPVVLTVDTDYPFDETVRIRVSPGNPAAFALYLRIPGWAEGATVAVAGETVAAAPGGFHVLQREWRGESEIELRLPMTTRARRRYNDSVTLERGPLVYALRVGEDWRLVRGEPPHGDWEVHPTTPWNYAIELDPERPERSVRVVSRGVGACPFSPEGAPVDLRVKGRRLPGWDLEQNAAAPPPASPVTSEEPLEELTLAPYGCVKLRVTEFPLLKEA